MTTSSKLALVTVFALACSSSDKGASDVATPDACAAQGLPTTFRFPGGAADGHADPFGAKAANQARAGRVRDDSMIVRASDAKAKIRAGDYVLANDHMAVYIAGARATDGYVPFGGEIISLEPVGDDGRPRGVSQYEESLIAFSKQSLSPDTVTVLNDGSDGKEAVVRASGVLKNVPLFDIVGALLRAEYNFPVAIDYVLAPGASKLTLRLSMANTGSDDVQFLSNELHAFLQSSRNQLFTTDGGYGDPHGKLSFLAFDAETYGFAWRLKGRQFDAGFNISSFQTASGDGLESKACSQMTQDYLEIIPGGPHLDGILTAVRATDGDTSQREVPGHVVEASGEPVPDAFVVSLDASGKFLSRTKTDAAGAYTIHVPNAGGTKLVATKGGYAQSTPLDPPAAGTDALIAMPARGSLTVHATEAGSGRPLPVRVQVVPASPLPPLPAAWGIAEPADGRIQLAFPPKGDITLPLPPGQHHLYVTRGYEYEMVDQDVTIEANKTETVDAVLAHSVDSTGVMCADFHEHSYLSPDADDAVELKVRSSIADGLDIPVSSEHEYVIDFQPVIESLGLGDYAFGMASQELTTWTIGHFGVVPKTIHPEMVNQGAVDWYGKSTSEIFGIVNALPEKPVLIVNHPHSDGLQGYFTQTLFNQDTATGDPAKYSDDYEAVEVFNDSDFETNRDKSVKSYFALLNRGKTVWIVGNSDSHHVRTNPVGYPRNCMHFGHDDPHKLSAEAIRDVLRSGNSVVSGGLTMTVEGPGGAAPGSTSTAGTYKVVVQSPAFIEAKTLEVVIDGVTTQTLDLVAVANPASPAHRYEASVDVAATKSQARHWVLFHAKGPAGKDLAPLHPGRTPFAVSNPIFF